MIPEWLGFDASLQALGIAVVVYLGQKGVDSLTRFLFNREVFSPIYRYLLRKVKIFKTRGDPVGATFSLSFTPEEEITVAESIDRLRTGFNRAEQASHEKISINSQHWDTTDRSGDVTIEYSDKTELFNIDVKIVQDIDSVRTRGSPTPEETLTGSVGLDIEFDFPFHLLEDTLFNLSSLLNYLEEGFRDQMRGSFSGGRFVICPVYSGLTIDEWIKEEQFDISLLLTSEDDGGATVEFFPDKAVVTSDQREIDAQTVKYVKELLLNYYL